MSVLHATGVTPSVQFYARKTAPGVRGGKTRRKNRPAPTASYWNTPQSHPVIDRQPPGQGYRHLLLVKHVRQFIELLPDWPELSQGLNAIVLAPGRGSVMGWHRPGFVAVCAWEREIAGDWDDEFVDEHRDLLDRLGVTLEPGQYAGQTRCHFTELPARGFQLLHILLHELGHHHDRMTTRTRRQPGRGEPYAEAYANQYAARIYDRYFETFGW